MLAGEQQVSTIWLQSVFLFCIVWGLGSTLTSDGQKVFDAFFRKLLNGDNKNHPKPKSFKLTKNQVFPDRFNIYEWIYEKKNNGQWTLWADTVDKIQQIPANAKVSTYSRHTFSKKKIVGEKDEGLSY